jgi:hypothetical protein
MREEKLLDAQLLHTTMEQCGGNAVKAAEALGVTQNKVYNSLHKNPWLRARWTRSKENLKDPDQMAVAIYRPVDPVPASEAEAARRAEEQVKAGFQALGLSGAALDSALAIQRSAGRQIKSWMELMAGGIVKQFLEIETEIKVITDRLNSKGNPIDIKTETMLRDDRKALLELRARYYDRAVKAQVNLALLKLKAQRGEGGGKKHAQPGFKPLAKTGDAEEQPIEV